MKTISLRDIFKYAEANVESRNMIEGEAVLKSGNLLLIGLSEKTQSQFALYCLCQQSSKISDNPHTIEGVLRVKGTDDNVMIIGSMKCSCKAGLGGKCKHIIAVLLYCSQHDICNLELVSSTDMKCTWKNLKGRALERYKPSPISTFCCYNKSTPLSLSTEEQKNVFDRLMLCDDHSIIYEHKHRIPSDCSKSTDSTPCLPAPTALSVPSNFAFTKALISNSLHSAAMLDVFKLPTLMQPCCSHIYDTALADCDVLDVAISTQCNTQLWKEARKFRVTGSRCYALFTYSKQDWESKSCSYFWPTSFSNKYTKFGIENEPRARQLYGLKKKVEVQEFGLIISHQNPWLAYSPDGVVFRAHLPSILIEIKCVYGLPDFATTSLLTYCKKWLQLVGDKICLKEKCGYNGQVQLGMALLNLPLCHLVIYCKKLDDVKIIPVKYNERFVCKLLPKLKLVYFTKMLHVLCKHKKLQDSFNK